MPSGPLPCWARHTSLQAQERNKDRVDSRRLAQVREERSSRRAERRLGSSDRKRVVQIRKRALERSRRRKRVLVERTWAQGRRLELVGRTMAHTTGVQLVHTTEPVERKRALSRRVPVGHRRALEHRRVPGHR